MKRIVILITAISLSLMIAIPAFSAGSSGGIQFSTSIGLGTGFPFSPDEFENHWDPSFGAILDVAAHKGLLEVSVAADYNFFLSTGVDPDDINILTLFLTIKIKPIAKASVRPYILVGAGYYRFWIVDAGVTDNTTGYQGGAGVEVDISKTQQIFIDVKQVVGRTRNIWLEDENTTHIPVRIGLTFLF
jgi:hypothetical protein